MTVIQRCVPMAAEAAPDDDAPSYDAREMVGDGVHARIVLDNQSYWLRITRAGKLILTK